jgi:hypothetical protein
MVGIACHVSATVTLLNATSPQENVLYGRFSSFLFLRLNCAFLELYPQHSRRPLRALRSGLSRKRFGWYSDGLSDLRMPVTSGEQQVCLCAELCTVQSCKTCFFSFATACDVSSDGEKISCQCVEGYFGARCHSCAAGYYGRPEILGI